MNLKQLSRLGFLMLVFLCSCNNSKSSDKNKSGTDSTQLGVDQKNNFRDCKLLFKEATYIDSILYQQTEVNAETGNKAIKAFTDYAYYCGNKDLSPIFLIKTAQVAASLNNFPQAKVALDKCIADYPNFKDIPAAIFLLAQLYDEPKQLNNEEEAKKLYEQIISKYPESPEAQNAQGALRFIGKTDKQMIEELKKEGKNISIQ